MTRSSRTARAWRFLSGLLALSGLMVCAACASGASDRAAAVASRPPGNDPPAPRASIAAQREAEARRIAALTIPGAVEQVAADPETDVWALDDELFPEPVARTDRPLALYEPVGDHMLHFAGTMLKQDEVLVEYEEALGEDLVPAGLAAWITLNGTRGWRGDVAQLNKALDAAKSSGGLLNLALAFSTKSRGPEDASDVAVATTDDWNGRIDEVADLIRESGVRVLLRIGNEINGWQGHHPFVFPLAYRKVVERFRARHADNVAFVWCVVPHGDSDIFGVNERGEARWFPGEDVIDWYSVNVFGRLHFSGMAGREREDADRFSSVTDQLMARARAVGKPVLIGETTPQHMNVVSAREDPRGEHGEVVWQEWFLPFLAFLDQHPQIKAVTMLPVDWRKTSAWPDWGDARIQHNPAIMRRWRNELSAPRWLHLPDVLGDTEGVLATRPETPNTGGDVPPPGPRTGPRTGRGQRPGEGRREGRGGR